MSGDLQGRSATVPVRRHFEQAARFFVETVTLVVPGQWDALGLGLWSVRDLVGHTSRALLTVEMYLQQPAARVDVTSPVDYVARVASATDNAEGIVRRGREAGAALGTEPPRAIAELAERALATVTATVDEALLSTPAGGMRLPDYRRPAPSSSSSPRSISRRPSTCRLAHPTRRSRLPSTSRWPLRSVAATAPSCCWR